MGSKYQLNTTFQNPSTSLTALTNHDQLRALNVDNMGLNTTFVINVMNISEQWSWIVGAEVDDDANYIQPTVPDGIHVWARIA